MLKKLYKHELHALFRSLFLLYIGVLALSAVERVMMMVSGNMRFNSQIIENMVDSVTATTTILYVLGIMAMFVISIAIIVVRFYRHIFSGEGYLTLSLPVKPYQHIICKLVCAYIAIIVGFIVTILSIAVLLIGNPVVIDVFREIFSSIKELMSLCGTLHSILYIIEFALMVIIAPIFMILMFYCAIAIGQNFKSRIGGAVLAYVILYMINQAISSIFSVLLIIPIASVDDYSIFNMSFTGFIHCAFIGSIVISLASIVAYFFITKYMMTKKLNLE